MGLPVVCPPWCGWHQFGHVLESVCWCVRPVVLVQDEVEGQPSPLLQAIAGDDGGHEQHLEGASIGLQYWTAESL